MAISNISKSESKLNFGEKSLIYIQHEVHLVYLLILWILGMDANLASDIPFDLFFLLYLFVIFAILSVIVTYRYLIRWMRKKENVQDAFFIILMVFICGAEVPSILGLIFGIIGIIEYNIINWQICFPLILFGFGHSLYLYFFKIKPYLLTKEEA